MFQTSEVFKTSEVFIANPRIIFYLILMTEYKASLVPANYYHVFNRAVGSKKLFLLNDNYHYFLLQFQNYILPVADVFCYCLLSNHFHFFIRIKEQEVRSPYKPFRI